MDEQTVGNLSCAQRCEHFFRYHWRGVVTLLTLIVFSPILFFPPYLELRCVYTFLVMAVYWVTEAMPIYITALIPIVIFPMFGIMHSDAVCRAYFNNSLLLFFGGLLLSMAIEYSKLHKRVGLNIILMIGCSPRRLHLGTIIVTTLFSMWISNSVAAAMMCPIIKAILDEMGEQDIIELTDQTKTVDDDDPPYPSRCVISFYLGIAYAATIGGCGTLIGTGTNVAFKSIYDEMFPKANDLQFLNFMLYSIGPMVVLTILLYLWLQIMYMGLFRPGSDDAGDIATTREGGQVCRQIVRDNLQKLGPITFQEVQVAFLFILMVALLVTRQPKTFEGWADVLNDKHIKETGGMFIIVALMFLLPLNYIFLKYCICKAPPKEEAAPSLLNWGIVHKNMPWGIFLLLGGGAALSAGIKESGLSVLLVEHFRGLQGLPSVVTQLMCILLAMIATNFTVNTAICTIFAPVILQMAVSLEEHPLFLGLPACMAFSMAFHLPVGTPPNGVAAGFGNIRTKDMMIAGIGPSVVAIVGYLLASQTVARAVFPDYNTFPDWAK